MADTEVSSSTINEKEETVKLDIVDSNTPVVDKTETPVRNSTGMEKVKKSPNEDKCEANGTESTPMETNGTDEKSSEENKEKKTPTKSNGTVDSSTEVNGKSPEKTLSAAEEANAAFLQGKRDFAIKDYAAAVTCLAKACELLATIHEEFADELGDAYYYYGRALFANARSESNVLGDKIENKENESDDEEDTEEADEEGEGDKEEEEEEKVVGNGDEASSELKTEDDKPEEESEEAEDADDLQLSWEILEMAKLIFQRRAEEDKNVAIKLCEVYLTLGENGLESERYDTAVNDFQSCLEIQKKNLNSDDRRIAETLYQLGIAYSMSEQFDEAIENFNASITQLNERLKSLETAKTAGKSDSENDAKSTFYTIDGEVKEIEGAIKEIRDKITDTVDYKKQLKNTIAKQMGFGEPSTSGASTSSAVPAEFSSSSTSETEAKPISNISHLVRKKRKNEGEEGETGVDKKSKTEEAN